MTARVRLKKTDISLLEAYTISLDFYKRVDNKMKRSMLDVLAAKITARKNLSYNASTHSWEQSPNAREVKFTFLISTDPTSYVKKDNVEVHKYPVIFLIRDFDAGIHSSFKSRVGGLKRWKSPKLKVSDYKTPAEKERVRKINQRILDQNIRNGLQADFIFRCMWVWKQYGLLFGPMTCLNRPPKETNPMLYPYFSKHEYWIITWLLLPILQTKKNIIEQKLFKNRERES